MKSKFIEWLETAAETMFSGLFQAKALIVTFGALGLCCLIGAFWNPWQLLLYEGMTFNRWTADIMENGVCVPWKYVI